MSVSATKFRNEVSPNISAVTTWCAKAVKLLGNTYLHSWKFTSALMLAQLMGVGLVPRHFSTVALPISVCTEGFLLHKLCNYHNNCNCQLVAQVRSAKQAAEDWSQALSGLPGEDDETDSDSDYVDSGGQEENGYGEGEGAEGRLATVDISAISPLAKRKRRWICEIPKSETQSWVNHNQHITDKLEELLTVYQNSPGDKWRAMSTTKVLQAIKKHPKEITSYEEARSLPFDLRLCIDLAVCMCAFC